MWCNHCGSELPEGGAFCAKCGTAVAKKSAVSETGFFSPGSLLDEEPPKGPAETAKPVAPASPAAPGRPVEPVTPAAPRRPVEPVTPAAPKRPVEPVTPAASAAPVTRPAASRPPVTKPAAPRAAGEGRRLPFGRELKLLLRQGWLVMLGEKRNLIFSLLFPVLSAFVMVWVAGKDMFENLESTKSACFALVCAAIWCGLFNSIQVVVKERENIKRDYVSGALRIECYVVSRATLQMLLCFVQSLILVIALPGVNWQYGNDLPKDGLIFSGPMPEYFISLFLVMLASDALGLLISSLVKKQELASQLAPYVLIVQLLFSGVLFKMEGAAEGISALMVSRWGMEALGSICDLNNMPLRIQVDNPGLASMIEVVEDSAFDADSGHLITVWLILLLFVVVELVAANISLRGIKKDTRM